MPVQSMAPFSAPHHFPVLGFSNEIQALGGAQVSHGQSFGDKLVQAVISAEEIRLDGEGP